MDYSKYDTCLTFYRANTTKHPVLNLPDQTEMVQVFQILGQVRYQKLQEYGTNEREIKRAVIRVPWHPQLKACTHVQVQSFYDDTLFIIELQQVPFQDGEVEMSVLQIKE
ncbi:hypothetical protein CF138_17360 [Aeromonas hydrophila]|uniref:hypothetical protein n=1 Tax=Aeromonas TaxID=642 RepID=UPI00111712A0|nr:hypothetical protein [Aeromonas hydrophila]TNH82869.1 hypothetical protein CF138_17360 [Aeromonas hydrophila]TNI00254.1 hypothetical protein CF136_10665 [Aeromonas hydrophila]TNI92865.1 hypothetical protein CF118_17975 [Aeromonas hydrophila]